MKSLAVALIIIQSSLVFAAVGNAHTFACKVGKFDATKTQLNCDPKEPKKEMTIDSKVLQAKVGKYKWNQVVKFDLTDKEMESWFTQNKMPAQASNEGKQ